MPSWSSSTRAAHRVLAEVFVVGDAIAVDVAAAARCRSGHRRAGEVANAAVAARGGQAARAAIEAAELPHAQPTASNEAASARTTPIISDS